MRTTCTVRENSWTRCRVTQRHYRPQQWLPRSSIWTPSAAPNIWTWDQLDLGWTGPRNSYPHHVDSASAAPNIRSQNHLILTSGPRLLRIQDQCYWVDKNIFTMSLLILIFTRLVKVCACFLLCINEHGLMTSVIKWTCWAWATVWLTEWMVIMCITVYSKIQKTVCFEAVCCK